MAQWEVIVSNIGIIYSGTEEWQARHNYADAVWRASKAMGRYSGENVTLMKDGEIEREYGPDVASE